MRHPAVRIWPGLVLVAGAELLLWARRVPPGVRQIAAGAVLLAGYAAFVRFVERRPARELSLDGAAGEAALGVALGVALMSAAVAGLWALGAYHVAAVNAPARLLHGVLLFAVAALAEELVFRLLLFRLLEERLGTWTALAISSALFGLIHLTNPHATLQGAAAIVVEAGTLLGAGFALTRRVWLVWGLHAAWNWTQSAVFGIVVSGAIAGDGLFQPRLDGPAWLTGGEFGIEASAVTVALCSTVACLLLVRVVRAGQVLPRASRRC